MIKNSFQKGPEGWCSYDYHASIVNGGTNIFVLTTWDKTGGVNGTGCIWADQSRWSADIPERPVSILPLIFYRGWIGEDLIDLREAQVSVYLRGDDLHLYGAKCCFWVHRGGTRWHYTGHPLEISSGCWAAEPNRFTLVNDESKWHRSWAPSNASLDALLGNAQSYGFSFTDFGAEVHGKLSMAEFKIILPGE